MSDALPAKTIPNLVEMLDEITHNNGKGVPPGRPTLPESMQTTVLSTLDAVNNELVNRLASTKSLCDGTDRLLDEILTDIRARLAAYVQLAQRLKRANTNLEENIQTAFDEHTHAILALTPPDDTTAQENDNVPF